MNIMTLHRVPENFSPFLCFEYSCLEYSVDSFLGQGVVQQAQDILANNYSGIW